MKMVLCDSNNVNSYGFRTSLDGMDLKRFQSNPVMLMSHDADKVIGRWENIAIVDGKLTADAVFDTDDEDAKKIAGKVERGFLRGVSVGLMTDIDDFVEDEYGNYTLTKSELMEASICAIPSDSNAIVLYDKKHTKLSFGDIKLKINNQININMAEVKELEAKLAEKDARIAEMEQRVTELEAQVSEAKQKEVDAYLEARIAEGKIDKSEKEGFAKLSVNDFETVKTMLDARKVQPKVSLSALQTKTAGNEDRSKWSYLQWMKQDPAGLKKLKDENPSEFARLQENYK